MTRQRVYALLVAGGAGILLGRVLAMLAEGSLTVLVPWVATLLLVEGALDLAWLAGAVRWAVAASAEHARPALRFAAAAILVHAARVLIFVMGRTGPWIDFDVRPEARAAHATRWSWGGVSFAAVMTAMSLVGLVVVWRLRSRGPTSTEGI